MDDVGHDAVALFFPSITQLDFAPDGLCYVGRNGAERRAIDGITAFCRLKSGLGTPIGQPVNGDGAGAVVAQKVVFASKGGDLYLAHFLLRFLSRLVALTSTPESWSIERMNRSPKSSVWYSMYLSSTASK